MLVADVSSRKTADPILEHVIPFLRNTERTPLSGKPAASLLGAPALHCCESAGWVTHNSTRAVRQPVPLDQLDVLVVQEYPVAAITSDAAVLFAIWPFKAYTGPIPLGLLTTNSGIWAGWGSANPACRG